jgi:non-ribosomal peptide synthetase component E (peptide arylation enzyme)
LIQGLRQAKEVGEDVVTAVVLKQNQTITPQQIREYLFQKLVDFKVLSEVIIVDEIPKGVLNLENISIKDNFFVLGGDSF